MTLTIALTDLVKVKLTERGKRILELRADEEFKVPKDGTISLPLFALLQTFGPYINPIDEWPFESEIVVV